MIEPLATIRFRHAAIEVWPGHVSAVFPDGLTVAAAPNGSETLVDTACHELAHLLVAELGHDRASVCLRGVAEGHGRQWTDEKHQEEIEAYQIRQMMAAQMKAAERASG